MVLHPVDYAALVVGILFGIIGIFGHGDIIRGTRAFLSSFSTGGSVVYLLAMGCVPLGILSNSVANSNAFALMGALLYAAIITVVQFFESLAAARRQNKPAGS